MAGKVKIDKWCYTEMKVDRYTYVWKIENFTYCPLKTGEFLKSSTFVTASSDKLQWCMKINPRGLDEDCKEYLSIYLVLLSCNKKEVNAKFKFSILDSNEMEKRLMESQRAYSFIQGKDWGFKKFVRRDMLMDKTSGFLTDNRLTLCCEINIVSDPITHDGRFTVQETNVPTCTLSQDMDQLFKTKKFADVTFNIGKDHLKAHKAILSARSAVFDAMFKHSMEEQHQARCNVDIPDIAADVFEEMIKYIYTGKEPSRMDDLALEMLAAADKYDLQRLKSLCENSISNNLIVDNAAEVLVIADMHNAEILKKNILKFINSYALEIVETEGYKNLLKNHSHLITDAFRTLARSTDSNINSVSRKKRRI
ncbi:Speckle-type POZ protein B [Trichoplax sp. H2]|nr:Speckle-type POZ protein B [Trichoplax sp. H2]|eukprot:RDD37731.1 Speckle-type POZ protein B [Trichoplax sp. H2]